MIKKIQKRFVLSEIGARNLVKASLSCTISYLVLALSIGVLFNFTDDLMTSLLNHQTVQIRYYIYLSEFIIVFILIYVAHYVQYNMTYYNTYKESARLRISLAEHLRKIPLSFFGKRNLSDLTTTMLADVNGMEQALSHFIPEFAGSILSTIILSISMFFFDYRMAFSAVWCIPVSFLLVIMAKKKLDEINHKDKALQIHRAEMIQEGLETMRDLKSNHFTERYLKEVDESIDVTEKSQIRSEIINAIFVVSAQLILKLGIVTVVLMGLYLLSIDQISMSVFVLFLIVASRLYDPLNSTLQNLAAIVSCEPRIERLDEMENYPIQEGQDQFEPQNYDIVFENVYFGYEKNQDIIHDVSFTVKQGEVTALIGPSGGGKSTCAKLAARFWDVSKGKITVGGVNIQDVDPEVLLSKYAIVFQDVILFNSSIMDNIRLGKKDASDEEVLQVAKLALCDEFVNRLPDGYQTIIGENGARLSGGERQRISIARALLKDAPIILLDEATASLDVESETFVQQALSHLIQKKTVIMIAHRMRTIANADHLIVLKEGRVVEEGTPQQLINKEESVYRHMTDLQNRSHQWEL